MLSDTVKFIAKAESVNIMTVISNQNIIFLGITCVVLVILPILAFAIWKIKCKKEVKIAPFFIGMIGFVVSARILEMIPHIFCVVMDNPVSRFINGNTIAFVLYGITMAGVFEECGRHIIMKYIWKKDKTEKDVIMYGIGHGGIEVWIISLPVIGMYLAVALMIRTMGLDAALTALHVTADQAEGFMTTIVGAASGFGGRMAILTIFERVIAISLHISLTYVVYYGVRENSRKYLLVAVLAHAVFDIFPALYQRQAVSMAVSEMWIFAWAVLIGLWVRHLYLKSKNGRTS